MRILPKGDLILHAIGIGGIYLWPLEHFRLVQDRIREESFPEPNLNVPFRNLAVVSQYGGEWQSAASNTCLS